MLFNKTIIICMSTWEDFIKQIENKEYYKTLNSFLDYEYSHFEVYPERNKLFNAFHLTPLENTKVVIIGQDPYHEPNQAMGLAFSVPSDEKVPPSLVNIFKEIENDLGYKMKMNGDLTYLAKQGVLLINAYLSVRKGMPLSHHCAEYEKLMLDIISLLNNLNQPIVFMLWGNFARKYKKYLQNPNHLVLESVHPSPLGANHGGWFNQHQFSKCNDFLKKHDVIAIDWRN